MREEITESVVRSNYYASGGSQEPRSAGSFPWAIFQCLAEYAIANELLALEQRIQVTNGSAEKKSDGTVNRSSSSGPRQVLIELGYLPCDQSVIFHEWTFLVIL